jgi:hypothetical protein
MEKTASILAVMLLPGLSEQMTLFDFGHGRALEYIVMEKSVLSVVCLLLILAMGACLFTIIRWRFAKGADKQSILLMPGFVKTAKIFLCSVIVPVIAYYILSRLPLTGGRDFNMVTNVCIWPAQVACLLLALLTIPIELTVFHIRKRFQELNIPIPETVATKKRNFFRIIATLLCVYAVLPSLVCQQPVAIRVIFGVSLVVIALLIIVNLLFRFWKSIFTDRQYSRYYSSVAKTLIPVFAGTIVLLVALSKPYVSARETYLVQNDPIIRIGGNEDIGFTSIESCLAKRLREEIKNKEAVLMRQTE